MVKRINLNMLVIFASFFASLTISSLYLLPKTFCDLLPKNQLFMLLTDGGYNIYHALTASVMFVTVWFAFKKYVDKQDVHSNMLWLSLLAYGSICILSCFQHDVESLNSCSIILISLSVGLLVALICPSYNSIFGLLWFVGTIEAVYALVEYINHKSVFYSGSVARAGGTFNQPNSLYTELLVCIFPTFFLMVTKRKNIFLLVPLLISVALMFTAFVLTGSRGGQIGFAFGFLGFFSPFFGKMRKILPVIITLLACLTVGSFIWRSPDSYNSQRALVATQSRISDAKENLSLVRHNILIGTGINRKEIPTNTLSQSYSFRSKNVLLKLIVELGLFGIFLSICLIRSIVSIVRAIRNRLLRGVFVAIWLSLLVASMFDVPFLSYDRLEGNVLFGILTGATVIVRSKQFNRLQEVADKPLEVAV